MFSFGQSHSDAILRPCYFAISSDSGSTSFPHFILPSQRNSSSGERKNRHMVHCPDRPSDKMVTGSEKAQRKRLQTTRREKRELLKMEPLYMQAKEKQTTCRSVLNKRPRSSEARGIQNGKAYLSQIIIPSLNLKWIQLPPPPN